MATTVPSAGALALAGCMAFLNPIAAAEPALPSAPSTMPSAGLLRFDLRVQPLQGALDAYGALTGRSGFYTAESIAGRSSAAVQGRYTPEVALQRLLEGTGLAIHYTAPDAFVLEPGAPATAEAPAEAARAPGPDDGLVQARVNEAFCGDPRLAAWCARCCSVPPAMPRATAPCSRRWPMCSWAGRRWPAPSSRPT